MKKFSRIVITGASSGIGEALALDYARSGVALALTGRDAGRLEAVAAACRAKGATVVADTIDVVDRERFAGWLTSFDDAHPVDLVIANAGISIDKDNSSLDDFSVIRKTLDVNVGGVLNTVEPLLSRMIARKRGQIAVVASLASFAEHLLGQSLRFRVPALVEANPREQSERPAEPAGIADLGERGR